MDRGRKMKGQQLEEGVGRKKKKRIREYKEYAARARVRFCGWSVEFVAFEGLHNAAFSERTT